MRRVLVGTLTVAALCLLLVRGIRAQPKANLPLTSAIALIANPEKYDGKVVETEGYVTLGYEDTAVFVTKADKDAWLTANAIFLDLSEVERAKFKKLEGNYCFVIGVFRNRHGHEDLFPGELDNIQSIRPLPRFD
jgi:hypothetical protein